MLLFILLYCGKAKTTNIYTSADAYVRSCIFDIIYLLLANSLVEDHVVYVGWLGVVEVPSYVIR